MSANEVKAFFEKYVFGFIFSDIEREINLAKSQGNGGNFLSALGLLCYTEVIGGIFTGSFKKGTNKSRFDAFFNMIGQDYKSFNQRVNVYKVFRCGMAHEYLVKENFVICMLSDDINLYTTINGAKPALSGGPSALIGPAECGVGIFEDEKYYFTVEKYYKDFARTCRDVYDLKLKEPNPTIPKSL